MGDGSGTIPGDGGTVAQTVQPEAFNASLDALLARWTSTRT